MLPSQGRGCGFESHRPLKMESFYPPKKSNWYLVVFLIASSLIAWSFLTFLRPIVIESGCSEIAQQSSGYINKDEGNKRFSYDNVKARCIEDSGSFR